MMQVSDEPSGAKPHFMLAACAAFFGSLSTGATLGFSSPSSKEFQQEFLSFKTNIFGSTLAFGALLGGLLAGYLTERLGRKVTIMLTAAIFSVGWVLTLIKSSPEELYASRLVLGLACGIDCMAIPVYIGEIVPPSKRGIFGTGHQFNTVLGIFLVYVLGGANLRASPLAVACMVPVVLTIATMFFMPESPTWLIKKNRPSSEITDAIYFLHGRTESAEAQREILMADRDKGESDFSLRDLLEPSVLRPLLIALALMLAQQASGINAIVFYTEEIFESAGSHLSPSTEATILGAVMVVFTIPGALLMDRAGRKLLLVVSSSACLFSLGMLIAFHSIRDPSGNPLPSLSWLPIFALSTLVAGFSIGLGPIPWLMMGELLPERARGVGTGLCTAFNWGAAFLVTTLFHPMTEEFGEPATYGIFAGLTLLLMVFVVLCVPETKGKTLKEIEDMFRLSSTSNMVASERSAVR